jgi:hypothetical protein
MQGGTTKFAPISETASIFIASPTIEANKTFVCIKGKSTKKLTGTILKCPKGYRLKK